MVTAFTGLLEMSRRSKVQTSQNELFGDILVEKNKDNGISKCVDVIKENLELNIKGQLHWNSVKGYPNKIMIMSSIKEMDIVIINIIIDTTKIVFINSNDIYNHFSGYLYERICWFVRDRQAVANINISSRGENLSKEKLIKFLKLNELIEQISQNPNN